MIERLKQLMEDLDPDDMSESAQMIRRFFWEDKMRADTDRIMNQMRLERSNLRTADYKVSDDGRLINRDGIEWHKAPIPRRFLHVHDVWTRMYGGLEITDRCACGAISSNMVAGGRWVMIDGWRTK